MRDIVQTSMQLDQLKCYDEGDGWGNAEPYLWTVFFKIDGTTVRLTDELKLSGSATVITTPGSHGNLGTSDVDEGDIVTIPDAIGFWSTTLTPIPVPASLKALGIDDYPAVAGIICILMEEDNVSDDGAEAGHDALNIAVHNALNEIIATRSISNQDITDQEIDSYLSAIENAITNAIKDEQNFLENIWSWLNPDDKIGSKVWQFTQDTLLNDNPTELKKRWKSEGDWEIFGHIDTSVLCPADAVQSIVEFFNEVFGIDTRQMRDFRDKEFYKYKGLHPWWTLIKRNTPQLASILMKDKNLRKSVVMLMSGVNEALKNRNKIINPKNWKAVEQIITKVNDYSNRKSRIDLSRALDVIPHLQGKTIDQIIQVLSAVQPARHPKLNKISKKLKPKRLMKKRT